MTHAEYAARAFGLDPCAEYETPAAVDLPLPERGQTIAIIGPSGAGKTLALRKLVAAQGALELPELRCEDLDTPVLELFDPELPSETVLRNLARVGLADGRLWQLKARCLSAGECRRLQLALALCRESEIGNGESDDRKSEVGNGESATAGFSPSDSPFPIPDSRRRPSDSRPLVIDEFDAHLDATTARIIAITLRRVVQRERLRLVVSTHRPETLADLQPARVICIDDGKAREINPPSPVELADEIEFVRGRVSDYARFAHWHYLGPGRPGPTSDVFLAMHEGRAVGVAMFGYPHLLLSARNTTLPEYAPKRIRETGAGELNANVRLLQRVVVEPRYRGIGVARGLIRHGLESISAPIVECIAQMGAFSDFLLGAGFTHLCDMRPPASVRNLNEFLARNHIAPGELLDAELRSRLAPDVAARLDRHIANVARTRVQTGFGSRRDGGDLPPGALRKALSRVGAAPGYFLWRRHATD